MKNILVINDNSAEAKNAAEFALYIAQKMQVNIVLANVYKHQHKIHKKVANGTFNDTDAADLDIPAWVNFLKSLTGGFKPHITMLDHDGQDESKLADFINKHNIWMMVKGTSADMTTSAAQRNFKAHIVLNKVLCPLLLVPKNRAIKAVENIAYITDLRYSRTQIAEYLTELVKPWQGNLSIAHLTAKGLPNITEDCAIELFDSCTRQSVNCGPISFNYVNETDFKVAADVMVNGLKNDILAIVNHHYYIEDILCSNIKGTSLAADNIPILIFPI
jgi:hypothetical protein